MGCLISNKCLDNFWIPDTALGPTDKRVEGEGVVYLSWKRQSVWSLPEASSGHCPLFSLVCPALTPDLASMVSCHGVRAFLKTAVLGLPGLKKSLFICANSLVSTYVFLTFFPPSVLISANDLIFSLQSSVMVAFILIRSRVQKVKLIILLSL